MNVLDKVRIVIYRYHEKGLEIFLMSSDADMDPDVWKIPHGKGKNFLEDRFKEDELISLDAYKDDSGAMVHTYAIEGDWHDIPSIRGLIKHDVKKFKSKIKEIMPDLSQGTYFAVKEAFKKVLPDEYASLKELKDILLDRNSVKYL